MTEPDTLPVALTIAGSDSGGGAGIQADLNTFRALGAFGTTAVTCVTAQNPNGVVGVEALSPEMVRSQIKAVCEGYPVAAAKTGMLYSEPIIHAVVAAVTEFEITNLVVDPVMVATSGSKLLREDAIRALCDELLPHALVVTPNADEAEILCGHAVRTVDDLRAAAREISEKWGIACIAKGGHVDISDSRVQISDSTGHQASTGTGQVLDVLYADGELHESWGDRIDAHETHGTGCTFAAAVTALLARGRPLPETFHGAKQFVANALRGSRPAGQHWPLNW